MKFLILLGSIASMAQAMCDHGTSLNPRDGGANPKFGYTGLAGPLNWHSIPSEPGANNMECALGTNQSPIDILPRNIKAIAGRGLQLNIPTHEHAELEDLITTLEVPVNGTLTLNRVVYNLKQFHFHTPSEHRLNGEHYPMEVHFVFEAGTSLAVVGFFIEVADHQEQPLELLENVFANVAPKTQFPVATKSLDFKLLTDHLRSSPVFQYSGSLTTPPCGQGVAWNVVEKPVLIDVATYRKIKGIMKFNSRYTQNTPGQINLLDNARNVLDA
ncbi:Carbonic anhydrase [Paramyrothecium foliicola]|nr:Carbonic anhydrase [Paramyrothecium foliicola]